MRILRLGEIIQSMEYQAFTMQDFESDGEPLLTKVDYLIEMFDLEVQNEKGGPIVITPREKQEHFNGRQSPPDGLADNVKHLGMTENGT